MATLLGSNAKPTANQEWFGASDANQHATTLTLPSGGPWRIVTLGAWFAGKDAAVDAVVAVWDAGGTLLSNSTTFSAAGRSFGLGQSDKYERSISPPTVSGGATVYVGFSRVASGAAQFGTDSSGNAHLDDTDASSPANLVGGASHATGTPGFYLYYEQANTLPNAPTLTGPADAAVVGDTTPTLTFTHSDPDSDPCASYDVQVDSTAGYGTPPDWASVAWESVNGTSGISGNNVTVDVGSALSRGTWYGWRARTSDAVGDGAWSVTRYFKINSLPTVASRDPGSADLAFIHNLGSDLALWLAAGTSAKPRFSWIYNDADSQQSLKYRVRTYKASSGGSVIYDSGEVASVVAAGAAMTHDATSGMYRGETKAATNIIQNGSSTDANNYVTASVTMKAGRLYLLSVENSKGSATADAVSSVTGGAGVPTFTSRSSIPYNSSLNRVSIWSAVPTADYTGTLTINFGGVTQTGAVWSLDELTGIDTTTTGGIVQQATGTGNSGTALATLAAFASAANPAFGAGGHAAATASAPGSGFTEKADQTQATPAQALATEWRTDSDTTVDMTFTSAQWGMCAVELQSAERWWTVEVWDTLGESSGESSRTAFKVRWGQGLFEVNPGAASSAWAFVSSAVAANTQAGFIFRSATSSGGDAASGKSAFATSAGAVPVQAWFQVCARLATQNATTQPALPDMTFNYIGGSTTPDRWTLTPTSEWLLDEDVRRYGAKSLKCSVQSGTAGDRTAVPFRKTAGDDVFVLPSTTYTASVFVKTNAALTGGSIRLELWSTGGISLLANSSSTTDTSSYPDGWQRLTVTYTTAGGMTAVRPIVRYTRTSGVTETFWVDGVAHVEGTVALGWAPGPIGKAISIDVSGLQIDAASGGIMRLRGSAGTSTAIVELGAYGLRFNGVDFNTGTSFPAGPVTNDLFYRTDFGLWFFYDGTRWLSEQQFAIPIIPGLALAADAWQRGVAPGDLWGTNFYYTKMVLAVRVATTHTSGNFWNIFLYDEGTGAIFTASTTWAIVAAADTRGAKVESPNVLSAGTDADSWVSIQVTKTGTPGTLEIYATVYGRIVAT